MSAIGRVGSAESCRTAASQRAMAWRSHGSGVVRVAFDDIQGLYRCSACHQLASQAGGPRPCLQQVHNTTPQSHRCEPESGSAAERGGDDPDAERLALRLVDDRSVVRPDKEASVGDQRSALTDRGFAGWGRRGRRPLRSTRWELYARGPLSYDHARTRSTRQSGWSHRRPGAARTRTRLDRTVFTVWCLDDSD
jgi:hypothetical protein